MGSYIFFQVVLMLCIVVALLALASAQSPRVRWPAPDFANAPVLLPDGSFSTTSLKDLTSDGRWAVIMTYPGDFTFVCTTELAEYSDLVEEFQRRKVNLVFVSVDTVHSHLAWSKLERKRGGIAGCRVPIVGDVTKELSKAYGVVVEDECGDKGL